MKQVSTPNLKSPRIFDWTNNRVPHDMLNLHRHDLECRQQIAETIEEMEDSYLFWKLLGAYQAIAEDKETPSPAREEALIAFAARMYIVGSMRGSAVIE